MQDVVGKRHLERRHQLSSWQEKSFAISDLEKVQ
jgi:hypothetical protein